MMYAPQQQTYLPQQFARTIIVFAKLHSLYCACISWNHTGGNCKEDQVLQLVPSGAAFSDTKSILNIIIISRTIFEAQNSLQ